MNLFQVVKSLQTIALSNPYIRNVGDGSIYDFMNANPSIRYGVFFVSQTSHREDDIFDFFGFNLFVIDRLVDNLESNRLQIQSVAKDVLSNTIKTFINKFLGITHEEIFYTPFTERFSDLCAGQYCNVEFRIPKAIVCEEDFEDIIPIHPDCPDMDDVYESGRTDGINYQKSLLTSTAITENGVYSAENGFNEVEVNVEGCKLQPLNVTYMRNGRFEMTADPGYNGFQSPFAITVDVPTGETKLEKLFPLISVNGEYTFTASTGYDGFESPVRLIVDVPQSGHTDEEMREQFQSGYTSGYTDGFESGHTSGITEQKNLLVSTAITENGTYTRENGFSAITVNVPQTGETPVGCTEYLTFEILSAGTLYWATNSSAFTKTIEYSKNDGAWTSVTSSSGGSGTTITTVDAGDLVRFRGDNDWYCDTVKQTYFATDCEFNVRGNILSLIISVDFDKLFSISYDHALCSIFSNCNKLISAANLKLQALGLTDSCYESMFNGCTSLIEVPELPAVSLISNCYKSMFRNCTSLTTAPVLSAPTLKRQNCYGNMFEGCTSLNYIKCLGKVFGTSGFATSSWLFNASATGTFVKAAGVNWQTGISGIPSGWTVVEE